MTYAITGIVLLTVVVFGALLMLAVDPGDEE